jgi:hypothetical protein
MENSDKKNSRAIGEKGISQLIAFSPNYEWKLIKIVLLKDIREHPKNILRFGGIFTEENKLILEQQINIEIIAETVSFAELLGAYLLAFSNKEKIIQKVLFQYKVKQITDLYKKIHEMSYEEINKLIGYPGISDFHPDSREKIEEDLQKSSENIKKVLIKIAKFYLDYLQFYNDYKHGFRIFPTTSSPPDGKTFGAAFQIINGKTLNQGRIYEGSYLKNLAEDAFKISNKIMNVLTILLPIFSARFIEEKKEITFTLFNDIEENKNNFKK